MLLSPNLISMSETADKELLEFLVKALVDHPDDVQIERRVEGRTILLILRVNPLDMGQVIGRQGMTAKAIRSLLWILGEKNNGRVNLKIEEPTASVSQAAATPDVPAADG